MGIVSKAPHVLIQMDIFSYGVVLWELVTQEIPRRGFLRDVEVPCECPQVRLSTAPRIPHRLPCSTRADVRTGICDAC